jgi:hypothetical protein
MNRISATYIKPLMKRSQTAIMASATLNNNLYTVELFIYQ